MKMFCRNSNIYFLATEVTEFEFFFSVFHLFQSDSSQTYTMNERITYLKLSSNLTQEIYLPILFIDSH